MRTRDYFLYKKSNGFLPFSVKSQNFGRKKFQSILGKKRQNRCPYWLNRVASEPGISGNLEKSGNFMALKKCQGKVREFRKIRKSQGILTHNWEKSGNFTCVE